MLIGIQSAARDQGMDVPTTKKSELEKNDESEGLEKKPAREGYGPVLRALYEAVLISDLDGRIVEANDRAEQSLGCSREILKGRAVSDTIAGFDRNVLAGVERHLAEGRFTVLDAYCRRKDGTSFPAEIAIGRFRLNQEEHLVFSVRNMEWRKRTQERLRTGQNALHNAGAGLVIADKEARVRYANPAFCRLWKGSKTAEAWKGRDIRKAWTDSDRAGAMVEKASAGEIWSGELEGRTSEGTTFFVQATAAPNRSADDLPVGLVFSFIDITDRKRAEDAIRREAEAQIRHAREKDDFSGLLNILSITDVIQLIDASRKSGWLVLLNEETEELGKIGFMEGQVVVAESGSRRGTEAFYEILRTGGHAFLFRQGFSGERDTTIADSTMGLLLEGSRRIDENAGT